MFCGELAATDPVSAPPALMSAARVLAVGLLAALPLMGSALARGGASRADRSLETAYRGSYRADSLLAVPAGVPEEIELLLPERETWPEPAREALAERIRREWPPDLSYGPLHGGVGLKLDYPLVTARVGRRVVVPVLSGGRLQLSGALQLRRDPGAPRRVVLLVDASSSANARTRFENPDGSVESISVLDAEHRAIEHLLGRLGDDWLELGIIAFGEQTWPIVEPGEPTSAVRARLREFRRQHPRGEGRTDTVCALWTAVEWLDRAPEGVAREIVLLTDGDTPHSGRFTNCKRGSREARAACEARRNTSECPARHGLGRGGSRSDEVQMARLGRSLRKRVRVSPVIFEQDRRARPYRVLAEDTGGDFVQVPSAQGIEVALPPLVAGRIRGVFARNTRTGDATGDLLTADVSTFHGSLPLVDGANDVELRVESDRGTAALLRFRVYSAGGYLSRYLAGLRDRNRALEERVDGLADEARELWSPLPVPGDKRGRGKGRERGVVVAPASADD